VPQNLADRIKTFCAERDWERFHAPKNLAMALTVEAAELLEIFQWMSEDESRTLPTAKLERAREEIGDVMILLTNLASHLGIDPTEAAHAKMDVNAAKYPADLVRGKSLKYDEYDAR
jgi:NTP pyrophosphatase (non-canonical NTP hydrolase)